MKKVTNRIFKKLIGLLLAGIVAVPLNAAADGNATALAKKTQNPVSNLISVPFENNINFNTGPKNKIQNLLLVKPVVPVNLGEEWNLINRAIVPVLSQPGIPGGQGRTEGLGDTVYQAFFSPVKPINGWIFGAGP